MATSTYKTFLMHNTGTSGSTVKWEKLIDIKDYPDIGGEPEKLTTTTLSDEADTSINGIQSMDSWKFTCNYSKADYDKLVLLKGKQAEYAIWMGASGSGSTLTPTGDEGKYKAKGELSIYINGKGVNEVREMTITIALATVPEPYAGA